MICPKCSSDNSQDSTFCKKCGASMEADSMYAAGGAVRMDDSTDTTGKPGFSILSAIAFALAFLLPPLGFILGLTATIIEARRKPRRRGFGLAIAAMPVTMAGGMLYAIALPAFVNYMRRAKTAEATLNLDRCVAQVEDYYMNTNQLPESSDWTPASPPGAQKILPSPSDWASPPWSRIGFAIDSKIYYRYRLTVDSGQFACEAMGDLDGDGQTSFFQLGGTLGTDGELAVESYPYKEDPLE